GRSLGPDAHEDDALQPEGAVLDLGDVGQLGGEAGDTAQGPPVLQVQFAGHGFPFVGVPDVELVRIAGLVCRERLSHMSSVERRGAAVSSRRSSHAGSAAVTCLSLWIEAGAYGEVWGNRVGEAMRRAYPLRPGPLLPARPGRARSDRRAPTPGPL